MSRSTLLLALVGLCALGIPACSKPAAAVAAPAKHEHRAPHGGTPVVIANEAYHLEFVRDAASGTLQAYVLDGELENFIRIAQPSIELQVNAAGQARALQLKAVANPATGETVGDTSLFEAQADWLKTTGEFDAVLVSVTIRGTKYADIRFNFPKGNDRD